MIKTLVCIHPPHHRWKIHWWLTDFKVISTIPTLRRMLEITRQNLFFLSDKVFPTPSLPEYFPLAPYWCWPVCGTLEKTPNMGQGCSFFLLHDCVSTGPLGDRQQVCKRFFWGVVCGRRQGEASDHPTDLTFARGERKKDWAHRAHAGLKQSQSGWWEILTAKSPIEEVPCWSERVALGYLLLGWAHLQLLEIINHGYSPRDCLGERSE